MRVGVNYDKVTMAKVHPIGVKRKPSRVKNVWHWCVAMAGFPLAYIMLPVSCCVRNPAAVVLHGDHDGETICAAENLATGCFGALVIGCCCGCCCGCCGEIKVEDF